MYNVYSDFHNHLVVVPINSPTERMLCADRRNKWRQERGDFFESFYSIEDAERYFKKPIYELGTNENGSMKYV